MGSRGEYPLAEIVHTVRNLSKVHICTSFLLSEGNRPTMALVFSTIVFSFKVISIAIP